MVFDMTRRSSQLSDRTPIQVTKCKILSGHTSEPNSPQRYFLATAGVPKLPSQPALNPSLTAAA